MKTLILCVDRDDDLGRKTDLKAPVVGRGAVLEAAKRLALADPEDSDSNSLFAAVSEYDQRAAGAHANRTDAEYEVAAVTGDASVGAKSDAMLVDQIERVLAQVRPDRLVLVSDGAEDEYILPLLESRIKIDAVRRVVVKQAANLEGAYYLFVRLFEDPKLQKKFVLPASIAIIVFGFAFAIGQIELAIGLGLLTLGGFLFIHAMQWEDRIIRVTHDLFEGLKGGKVSFFTTILAFALIAFGALRAWSDVSRAVIQEDPLLFSALFLNVALWWMIAGLILNIVGRALDELVRFRSTKGVYWRMSFGLVAVGFILEGLTYATIEWRAQGTNIVDVIIQRTVYTNILVGLFIAALGNVTYRYVRDTMQEEEEPQEPEPEGDRIRIRRSFGEGKDQTATTPTREG